jgi:hypothetical protein
MTDDNALGVILSDYVPDTYASLPRSTNGEIFGLINTDLAYVSDLASFANGGNVENNNNKFISADFVKAFKARMAAYRGDYTTAGALADELIADYPLTVKAQYPKIWTDAAIPPTSSDEVIFKLERVNGDGTVGSLWASVNSTINGSPFYEMSTDLFNLLNNPNDVRYESFINSTSDVITNRIVIGKYSGSGGYVMLNDIKVFRSSEMVFIKAEALASTGDLPGVAAELQLINNARFGVGAPVIAVPADTQAAWAEILKQRRIELCYEGHRYLDLKRLGTKAGVSIQRDPADCAINGACSLETTDHRFTMPIPSSETSANPAIRPQQNPGYTN